jgi:hypothetical protein
MMPVAAPYPAVVTAGSCCFAGAFTWLVTAADLLAGAFFLVVAFIKYLSLRG